MLTKTAVTDEIGSRFYPNRLPKNATLPCAVYNTIDQAPEHHLGGASPVTKARIQVDLFAATRSAVDDAANGLRDAADGYVGAVGSEFIQTCHLEQQRDEHDDAIDASEAIQYRISQDWMIAVTETIPNL
jgi:hypothetical protein